jgi:hypothetical protein
VMEGAPGQLQQHTVTGPLGLHREIEHHSSPA